MAVEYSKRMFLNTNYYINLVYWLQQPPIAENSILILSRFLHVL